MIKIAIEFKNVNKKFEKSNQFAVSNINIKIEEGSFITILGTSGSGKTTLLKMINRIHENTSGEIFFFGENIKNLEINNFRRKIGYVIQQIGLFPHMTIEENIATVPKILKWNRKEIEERIDYLLHLVSLDPKEFKKKYPRQLSGGQQQRVGLARAMAANPDIMLMDEPFGALDSITRENLQDELITIQKKLCKTIFFVTHDIDEALKLGDKVLIMNKGEIQQYDTPYNIVLNPANDFVSKLVSSEDIIQKLKVTKAIDVVVPLKNDMDKPNLIVNYNENLKNVLIKLLANNVSSIGVKNVENILIGKITFEQLKIDFIKQY